MSAKKNDIYESACGNFIVAPPSGVKLRSYNILKTTDSNEEFNRWQEAILTHNDLNLLGNFTLKISDRVQSARFMEEYMNDFKKNNPPARIYKDKRAISVFICKSIKTDLLRLYSS